MKTEMITSWRANCKGLETDCSKHTEVAQEKIETCKLINLNFLNYFDNLLNLITHTSQKGP